MGHGAGMKLLVGEMMNWRTSSVGVISMLYSYRGELSLSSYQIDINLTISSSSHEWIKRS
jgi:hypothetical protein